MFFMSVFAKSEAQILYPLMQCTDIFFLKVEGETVVAGAVPTDGTVSLFLVA